MKKINKRATFMVSALIVGSMAFMSGCSASSEPGADNVVEQSVQEESSVAVTEPAGEELQSTQIETESETVNEIETDTNVETETNMVSEEGIEKKTEVETGAQTQEKAESGSQEQTPEVQEVVTVVEGSVSERDFAVVVKGVTVPIKGDMGAFTSQLGEPDEFGSARSCVEAGEDKVYTYGGVVIYTYITNGVDVISLIEITGGEALVSGIHIGSTKAEVIAAYGSSYTEEGTELLYELGNKTIGLQMSGDTVSFMELF